MNYLIPDSWRSPIDDWGTHSPQNYWLNKRGNLVIKSFESTERYKWDAILAWGKDYCPPELEYIGGWKQFDTDQDAWYFGFWVDLENWMTFNYAEGDLYLVVCGTKESFQMELLDAEEFYGSPPPAWTVFVEVESGKWERADIYDERPKVKQ